MELVANNQHRMSDIAEKVGQIVEREAQDMWELGSLLCEARAICDDPVLSVLEGIEGRALNNRFNNWLSGSRNLSELAKEQRTRSMNLHRVFGHRRDEVKSWKTSALYELATDKNTDVRSQILREFPNGVKVLDMRAKIAEIRTPANTGTATTTESTTIQATTTTQQNEASQDLLWEKAVTLSGLTIDELEAALSDHTHPQFMVASRLKSNRDRLSAELAPLGKPEQKRVMKAVVGVLTHEQDVFQSAAKAAVPKYNKDLEKRLKSELVLQKKATLAMNKILKVPFDKKDFKFIRGVLHSDREVTQDRMDKAFNLFLKLEPMFK